MSTSTHDFDFSMGRVFLPPFLNATLSAEADSRSESRTSFAEEDLWFSGMAKVPENISDVIVNKLKQVDHVKAILMGRSGDVYHIWTLIDEWSASARKNVYGAQKELLRMLSGFELDFYVVPLDECAQPGAMVSDIPQIFPVA
jgi:hypothetical protein